MKWTNRYGLNEAIAAAVRNDPYSKGDSDYSVTELLKPARQRALEKKHFEELERDVSDSIWSLFGQVTHGILERSATKGIAEKRYYATFLGKKISAQVDLLNEDGTLEDYKTTTVYKAMPKSDKSDFVSQMNLQKWVLEQNGIEVKKLQVVALLRDWSKMAAMREPDYPVGQVVIIPIVIWKKEMVEEFLTSRITEHEKAKEVLPECNSEERWEKPPRFAVMKKGRSSAVRLFFDKVEAEKFLSSLDLKTHYLEVRKSASNRCEFYCAVGAQGLCEQFEKEKTLL